MLDALLGPQMIALLTVIGIDLVLSGDNAVVIGTAAAGLSADLRRRAIVIGINPALTAWPTHGVYCQWRPAVSRLMLVVDGASGQIRATGREAGGASAEAGSRAPQSRTIRKRLASAWPLTCAPTMRPSRCGRKSKFFGTGV